MGNRKFLALAAVVLMIHMMMFLFFGTQKIAFHEDEYYTYYTSAGYMGINPWLDIQETSGHELLNHFVVMPQHRFDFPNIAAIQAIDVHPPLYYMTLHFLMSCFPGQFYKWFGILLNGCYSLVSCAGIIFFISRIEKGSYGRFLALAMGLLYAVHPASISNVMFTRMYCMSVMWTVLYIDLFVLLMQNLLCSPRKFALLGAAGAGICYCAFLTHYFCLFIPFFLTLSFCIYAAVRKLFFHEKCFLRMLLYGSALLLSIGLAILSFPASLYQIFGNDQGVWAFSTLLNADLFSMFLMFLPMINQFFFAGMMYPILVLLLLAILAEILMARKRKKDGQTADSDSSLSWVIYGSGLASGAATVWLLSKTSLYLSDYSSRYFYTAFALLLPLMGCLMGKALLDGRDFLRIKMPDGALLPLLLLLTLLPALAGYPEGNVLYLYREKQEALDFAQENASYPCVMLYDQNTRFKTWYTANEIWPYDKVILAKYQTAKETLPECETLKTAERIIVYMDGSEEMLELMIGQNPRLSTYSLIRQDQNYFIYLLE